VVEIITQALGSPIPIRGVGLGAWHDCPSGGWGLAKRFLFTQDVEPVTLWDGKIYPVRITIRIICRFFLIFFLLTLLVLFSSSP